MQVIAVTVNLLVFVTAALFSSVETGSYIYLKYYNSHNQSLKLTNLEKAAVVL